MNNFPKGKKDQAKPIKGQAHLQLKFEVYAQVRNHLLVIPITVRPRFRYQRVNLQGHRFRGHHSLDTLCATLSQLCQMLNCSGVKNITFQNNKMYVLFFSPINQQSEMSFLSADLTYVRYKIIKTKYEGNWKKVQVYLC